MIEYITWFTYLQYLLVSVNGGGFGVPVAGKREILAKHPLITTLQNYYNINFYGYIRVGTPQTGQEGQKLNVLFDTGSADLVIVKEGYEKKCNSKSNNRNIMCGRIRPRAFDPSKSTTDEVIRGVFSVPYVGGTQYNGHTVLEYLEIGEGESKTRVLTPVGLADVVTNSISMNSDGIMGLGFGIGSNSRPQTLSPLECIFTQTDIPKQLGYYIQRDETISPAGSYGGELYFGGHNPNYINGEFMEPVPVVPEDGVIYTWNMAVKSITIGAHEIDLENNDLDQDGIPGTMAVPDTGTVDLVITEPIFQLIKSQFLTQVPQSQILFSNIMFLCGDLPNTLPDITFVANDKVKLTLGPQDYIEMQDTGLICRLAIVGNAYHKILFGNIFLSKYYTVFDYGKKEMKFALSKQPKVIAASRKQQGQIRMRGLTTPQLRQYRQNLKDGLTPVIKKS